LCINGDEGYTFDTRITHRYQHSFRLRTFIIAAIIQHIRSASPGIDDKGPLRGKMVRGNFCRPGFELCA
jgi:hypothetical protein